MVAYTPVIDNNSKHVLKWVKELDSKKEVYIVPRENHKAVRDWSKEEIESLFLSVEPTPEVYEEVLEFVVEDIPADDAVIEEAVEQEATSAIEENNSFLKSIMKNR